MAPAGADKATQEHSAVERLKWRLDLREDNANIWKCGPHDHPGSLDSSLKRNSTFIKKLRQGAIAESKDDLLRDLAGLNVVKYLEELIPAIPDLLAKSVTLKDRLAAVQVCGGVLTSLFLRYTSALAQNFQHH